jgi:hypothetical protein
MIATIGLTLIASNGKWRWILQRIRKTGSALASWTQKHVKVILIASVIGLWLVNPCNSHETCIQASKIAESLGAYQAAIVFTKLARDTFPTTTWCVNCYAEIQADLTGRMDYLERKNAGEDTEFEQSHSAKRSGNETNRAPSWKAVGR